MLPLAPTAPALFAASELVNPNFDTGIAGWSAPAGTLGFGAGVDFDDCIGSGSAHGSSPVFVAGSWVLEIQSSGSCVAVTPGEVTYLTFHLLPGAAIAATDVGLLTYTDADCTAGEVDAPIAGYATLPQIWLNFQFGSTIAAGAQSARFYVRFTDASNSTYQLHLDRAYLGFGQPVFTDDFEAGSPCRWTSVAF
jgi:hypothetical protein